MPRVPLHPDLSHAPKRYASHLNRCERWQGALDQRGYPRTKQEGRSAYAHRVAFERHSRPLQAGERVYRRCGDRACVNPYHLTTERPKTKRQRKRPSSAKLTPKTAAAVRRRWRSTARPTQRELAKEYGVSRSAISLVVRGITWRDGMESSTVASPTSPARLVSPRWDPETGILIPESLRPHP